MSVAQLTKLVDFLSVCMSVAQLVWGYRELVSRTIKQATIKI